jgi:hypothetical protein
MDAAASAAARVPPSHGGAGHQLVITATHDLRDGAVPCTCLRAAGQDPDTSCAAAGPRAIEW